MLFVVVLFDDFSGVDAHTRVGTDYVDMCSSYYCNKCTSEKQHCNVRTFTCACGPNPHDDDANRAVKFADINDGEVTCPSPTQAAVDGMFCPVMFDGLTWTGGTYKFSERSEDGHMYTLCSLVCPPRTGVALMLRPFAGGYDCVCDVPPVYRRQSRQLQLFPLSAAAPTSCSTVRDCTSASSICFGPAGVSHCS